MKQNHLNRKVFLDYYNKYSLSVQEACSQLILELHSTECEQNNLRKPRLLHKNSCSMGFCLTDRNILQPPKLLIANQTNVVEDIVLSNTQIEK